MIVDIRRRMDAGTFEYRDFFPESPRAQGAAGEHSLKGLGELWLAGKGRLASATKSQYKNALTFWYELLVGRTDVRHITHGQLAAKIGSYPWPSAKLCNNYMIPLRGIFTLAGRDLKIDDPTKGIENAKVQKKAPDPFTLEEAEAILADMAAHYDERVLSYYEYAFFTGERPEEEIAQMWADLDFNHGLARVERARSFRGELKEIKTYQVRDVDLLERAMAALDRMAGHTKMKSDFVFENPVTGKPWHDERSQRDHYWKPALKRLGIRYRSPYQTRHTYATIALMNGVNPAYIARQLGHKSAKMLFEVYAKWIDHADRGREKAKIEAALRGEFVPPLSHGAKNTGRRDWNRTIYLKPHHRANGK